MGAEENTMTRNSELYLYRFSDSLVEEPADDAPDLQRRINGQWESPVEIRRNPHPEAQARWADIDAIPTPAPPIDGKITLVNPIQFEPETATTVVDFEAELRRTDQYQITADIPHDAAWDRFSNDFFHHMNRYPSETEPGVRFRLSDAGGYSLRLYVRTDIKAKIPEVLTEDRQIPTTAWRELSNKSHIIWDMLHRGFELRAKKPKKYGLDD